MQYVIDTCVISELSARRPSEAVAQWFGSVSDEDLYLSAITIGELNKGVYKLSADDPQRERLEKWLDAVRAAFHGRILQFDDEIAMGWGQLLGESIRVGKTRPATDAQIAATALHYGMTLVTRNVRDFLHTGVNVVNPFDGVA